MPYPLWFPLIGILLLIFLFVGWFSPIGLLIPIFGVLAIPIIQGDIVLYKYLAETLMWREQTAFGTLFYTVLFEIIIIIVMFVWAFSTLSEEGHWRLPHSREGNMADFVVCWWQAFTAFHYRKYAFEHELENILPTWAEDILREVAIESTIHWIVERHTQHELIKVNIVDRNTGERAIFLVGKDSHTGQPYRLRCPPKYFKKSLRECLAWNLRIHPDTKIIEV